MTAVLSATDALRRDRIMPSGSLDDSQVNYSAGNGSIDWKDRYYEVADMLAETRAELQDFQATSKDLEDELLKELERTEKVQQDLKVKVARAETERDEWKYKFMSLQTMHNTTTTSLQRELDILRQSHQQLKIQLRDLELGNDDLERNERAVVSTLADLDTKYSRALEEKILLEHELLDKASMEEECQRLKDELRDANLEVTVLKDKLAEAQSRTSTIESVSTSTSSAHIPPFASSEDDIMKTPPPTDLLLSDLTTTGRPLSSASASTSSSNNMHDTTPRQLRSNDLTSIRKALPKGVNAQSSRIVTSSTSNSNTNPLARSSLPTWSPYNRPPNSNRMPQTQLTHPLPSLTASALGASESGPKSKAVQLVSDMRARIRNIDRMITGVPRRRVGSTSGKPPTNSVIHSSVATLNSSTTVPGKRRGTDVISDKAKAKDTDKVKTGGDNSGWVLIMDDAAIKTPNRDSNKPRRRLSGSSPSSYRTAGQSGSSPASISQSENNFGVRRPQSRMSISTDGRNSISTTATVSSIPTPTSRPTTPSYLPVPSTVKYNEGAPGMKRSIAVPTKRSSLGSTVTKSSLDSLPLPPEVQYQRPISSQSFNSTPTIDEFSSQLHTNVTVRSPRLPIAGGKSQSILAQSRIGRPASLGTRKSTGLETTEKKEGRMRAGSGTASGGKIS